MVDSSKIYMSEIVCKVDVKNPSSFHMSLSILDYILTNFESKMQTSHDVFDVSQQHIHKVFWTVIVARPLVVLTARQFALSSRPFC